VKYINGDEYARIQSRTVQNLLTRTAHIKDKNGHNLSAFYKLKPDPDRYKSLQTIPNSFFQPFSAMANAEIAAVLDGKSTLDDALRNIQEKGQVELNKVKEDVGKK
jgi:multiple sugar transport system substrate-binding protein